MNKKLTLIIIILLFILILIVKSTIQPEIKNYREKEDSNIIKINDFKTYNYIHSLDTINFQNKILIYDKSILKLLNKDLKEEFQSNIVVNNYEIAVNNSYIFLLDKTLKKIYKIDQNGVVVDEEIFDKNIIEIYTLANSNLALIYTTDANVDGILFLSEDLNILQDLNYPDSKVNIVSQNPKTRTIIVNSLLKTDLDCKCKIYCYNEKFELVMTKSFKDIIAMDLLFKDDKIFLLDPDFLYVYTEEFEKLNKFPSTEFFNGICLTNSSIYLLDGNRKLDKINENNEIDSKFMRDNDILGIFTHNDKPCYYTDRKIFIGEKEIATQNDIKKIFSLNQNGLAVIFRNGIKVIDP